MKMQMFSVYDSKAEAFLPAFTCGNVPVAQRNVADCLTDPEHPFTKNPQDYTLFHLGEWDDQTAHIELLTPARNLGLVSQYSDDINRVVPIKGVA